MRERNGNGSSHASRRRALVCVTALALGVFGMSASSEALAAPPANPLQIVQNEVTGSVGQLPALRFPADDAAHGGNFTEWWQWWLHLRDQHGRRYAVAVVFYQFPISSALDNARIGIRRTDLRWTDVSSGSVYSFSKWYSAPLDGGVPNGFDLSSLGQSAVGGGGNDRLQIAIHGHSLDVQTKGKRPAIPIGADNGVNRVDPLEMLQIYERWRMPTRGTMRIAGRRLRVTGTSWFEHGWGNAPSVAAVQWDYFQLELADGRDILVVQVRHAGGTPNFAYVGGIRDRSGALTRLHQGDFTITSTGTWRRDATCSYPSGWIVTVKGERFVVTPTPTNQEVRSAAVNFWDGETTIAGSSAGRGTAELLNTCYLPSPLAQLG